MSFKRKKVGRTVLIVEDDRSISDTVSTVLDIRGFNTLKTNNGKKALELIRKRKPDLVVLDLLLPGLDGLKVCEQIKSDPHLRKIPVLIITVVTKDTDLTDGFWKVGTTADEFITKPFDPFFLVDRIEALLNLPSSDRNDPETRVHAS